MNNLVAKARKVKSVAKSLFKSDKVVKKAIHKNNLRRARLNGMPSGKDVEKIKSSNRLIRDKILNHLSQIGKKNVNSNRVASIENKITNLKIQRTVGDRAISKRDSLLHSARLRTKNTMESRRKLQAGIVGTGVAAGVVAAKAKNSRTRTGSTNI